MWYLDVARVREACQELGLTHPVMVVPMTLDESRDNGYTGVYTGLRALSIGCRCALYDLHHQIKILKSMSAADASGVLWHELGHAVQCEAADSWEEFEAAYWAHPQRYEREVEEATPRSPSLLTTDDPLRIPCPTLGRARRECRAHFVHDRSLPVVLGPSME